MDRQKKISRDDSGLVCPKCGSNNLTVRDTRGGRLGEVGNTRRRRTCNNCNKDFRTVEVIFNGEDDPPCSDGQEGTDQRFYQGVSRGDFKEMSANAVIKQRKG